LTFDRLRLRMLGRRQSVFRSEAGPTPTAAD
jgi:hypothetical protein